MSQKFDKLKALLKELFQLDQPDLDFGIYRILHARSSEVLQFLDQDLLPQVRKAFEQYQPADKAALQKELAKAIEQAQALGADSETLPKVKELRAKLDNEAVDLDALESEVYDHLYSFFRRYYSEGDFLSKRVYKPGVYAIPYEGEEVKLHWANSDQYYIKTSEYLRDYAFRLQPENEKNPMRVHFKLVDAAEGEHGNVKATEGKDRVFILAPSGDSGRDFVSEENGELILHFEYRSALKADWSDDAGAEKKKPPSQKDLLDMAVKRILALTDKDLVRWIAELGKPHIKANKEKADYSRLQANLDRYTKRNTFDYFIHKDLGGFLRRELNFYIKNEVMHLDDIESDSAPRVEQYLSKIKVIRGVSGKIIEFLTQLEEFQKRLWLKKKFVIGTSYCITLDRIREEFYSEIAANNAQREQWVKLFSIDKVVEDTTSPSYSVPLSVNFLKANPALVVDTELFDPIFVERLLDQMDALDESINGVLIHSDNFQALRFLKEKYTDKLDAIYVDPPYNTDATPIVYKNGYRKSSWASFIGDRLEAGHRLLGDSGNLCITIDDYQLHELKFILSEVFGDDRVAGTVVIRSNPSGRPVPAGFAQSHEYAIFAGKTGFSQIGKLTRTEKQSQRYKENDQDGPYMWELFRKRGSNSERINRRTLYYPIYATESSLRVPEMHWDEANRSWVADEGPKSNEVSIYPIDDNKVERTWRGKWENVRNNPENYIVKRGQGGELTIYYKFRPADDGVLPTTTWIDSKYSATEHGTGVLRKMFTEYHLFDFPKSVYAVIDCIWVAGMSKKDSICMDFFGGSGTTAHAVIEMNRADAGERKFILVETESYFDTVLVPRIKKISYSAEWSGGRPISKGDGYSLFARCLRLETYEDALNNLNMRRSADQQSLLDLSAAQGVDNLKEQYLLSYMLDVETRGSQSLLNVQAFTDPTAYKLKVKRPGSDESREVNVDLLETFNWLVGLTVQHIAAPQVFAAESERDKEDRLQLKGRLKQDVDGPYWFRTVTGTTPDGRKTLIIWRKLTGNAEQDNLVLDEWFRRQAYSSKDAEFDLIYVNGDNNLENLKAADETWKVRLIEEDFHRLMFDTEGA